VFLKGVGQFKPKFPVEGDIAHQPLLVSDYPFMGIKISAGYSFILSQSTHVSDRLTEGPNYDPQDRASIAV